MHFNQAPFVTVAKVSMNKSAPLVEDVQVGKITLGVQYDTGCQLSIISRSALSTLPPSMYFLGTSSQIRVMTYAGEGKIILTTEVKLKLPGKRTSTMDLVSLSQSPANGGHRWDPQPCNTLNRSLYYWGETITSIFPRRLNGILKV